MQKRKILLAGVVVTIMWLGLFSILISFTKGEPEARFAYIVLGLVLFVFSIYAWWSRSKKDAKPILSSGIQMALVISIAFALPSIIRFRSNAYESILGLVALWGVPVILLVTLIISKNKAQ